MWGARRRGAAVGATRAAWDLQAWSPKAKGLTICMPVDMPDGRVDPLCPARACKTSHSKQVVKLGSAKEDNSCPSKSMPCYTAIAILTSTAWLSQQHATITESHHREVMGTFVHDFVYV